MKLFNYFFFSTKANSDSFTFNSAARYQFNVSGLIPVDKLRGSNSGASTSDPTNPLAKPTGTGGAVFFTGAGAFAAFFPPKLKLNAILKLLPDLEAGVVKAATALYLKS